MSQSKKKILISCSAPSSLIHFRGKLIEELVKNNRVYVFTPKITDDKMRVRLTQMGIEIFENSLQRNNISIISDLKYVLSLGRTIRKIKPDVFFSYTFKPLIFGSIVASVMNVKNKVAMLTGLGYSFTDTGKSTGKSVTQALLKFSLKLNRDLKIVFQNQDDRQELLTKNIIDTKSRTYIVNGSGVDLDFYKYSKPEEDNIRFLLIARLIKAKGVQEFYHAAKIIHEKYPSAKFSIVGSYNDNQIDSIDSNLHKEIINSDFIDYTGWVDDVRPYIVDSSVVVLPSYREGTPRSILEAMAMGRAVITTDTPGCRETVNTDPILINGHLVPIKNISELVSKMESYILNPGDSLKYGINGRAYAEEKFDVHKVNKQMLEILLPEN